MIYKCIRCGACRAVCPTFGEELSELAVARGRMALVEAVLEGNLELTPAFEKAIFHCAMCGACKANCPSGVDVPAIVEAVREELVKKRKSEPLMRFLAKQSLKDRRAMDRAFALMALGRAAYGPLAATLDFKRSFPKAAFSPLTKRLPGLSRAENPKGAVAFFIGCAINYIYPQIGEAAVRVLNRAGYDVMISKEEHCCGKPLKSLGEAEAYRPLAEKNASLFGGMDVRAVVTACPTCALTLREDYLRILPESPEAKTLAGRVEDINSFLVENSDIMEDLGGLELAATYHDPCHLNFGMGIKAEPRALINAATGGGLVEMPESERCCGFGGSFSFINYGLSSRIAARKAGNIASTGAGVVATACPGCILHIKDALTQAGSDVSALHVVEIMDMALNKKQGGRAR